MSSKLVAIQRAQFRYALESLIAMGVVRNYLPGFAGHYLFGKREGVYWLNLGHETFGDKKRGSIYVLDPSVRGMFSQVDRIYSSFQRINVRYLRGAEKDIADRALRLAEQEALIGLPEGGHRFFLDGASPWARQHLKCFLAEQACFVLERHIGRWPETNDGLVELKDQELIELIHQGLGSDVWLEKMEESSAPLVAEFADFLAGWVIWIAADAMKACRESLQSIGLESLLCNGVKFRMYLNDEDNNPFGGLALGIFPVRGKVDLGCDQLIVKTKEQTWEVFGQEADIDKRILEGMGLRRM